MGQDEKGKRGRIQGTIQDSSGHLIDDATVFLVPISAENPPACRHVIRTTSGHFDFAGVDLGTYAITATSDGLTAGYAGEVIVDQAQPSREVEVVLGKGERATLSGRLLAFDGRAVANGVVIATRLSRLPGNSFVVFTSGATYAITVPRGRYLITAESAEGALEKVWVDATMDRVLDLGLAPIGPQAERLRTIVGESLKARAVPVQRVGGELPEETLAALESAIAHARLVAVGEATHGGGEFTTLKRDIFRDLVKRMGFRALAIEADWAECLAVNDYVLGKENDASKVLAGLRGWMWDTEQMYQTIHWMREYNQTVDGKRKVFFLGFDMQASELASDLLIEYLEKHDPRYAKRAKQLLRPLANPFLSSHYAILPEKLKAETQAGLREIGQHIEKKESGDANQAQQELAQRHVRALTYSEEMKRSGFGNRDKMMAENILWLLDHFVPQSGMLVSGHNLHIAKQAVGVGVDAMGSRLREALQDKFMTIAIFFEGGSFNAREVVAGRTSEVKAFTAAPPPDESVEALLARVQLSEFFVDLREFEGADEVSRALRMARPARVIGNTYDATNPSQFFVTTSLWPNYDLVWYLRDVKASDLNKTAMKTPVVKAERPRNLDFSEGVVGQPAPGWQTSPGSLDIACDAKLASGETGQRHVTLSCRDGQRTGAYGSVQQLFDAKDYGGKKLKFSARARARSSGKTGEGYLWMRVYRAAGDLAFFGGMIDKPIRSKQWSSYEIEGEVPRDAASISIGLAWTGVGEADLKDVALSAER